jgi:hypothetical protein
MQWNLLKKQYNTQKRQAIQLQLILSAIKRKHRLLDEMKHDYWKDIVSKCYFIVELWNRNKLDSNSTQLHFMRRRCNCCNDSCKSVSFWAISNHTTSQQQEKFDVITWTTSYEWTFQRQTQHHCSCADPNILIRSWEKRTWFLAPSAKGNPSKCSTS